MLNTTYLCLRIISLPSCQLGILGKMLEHYQRLGCRGVGHCHSVESGRVRDEEFVASKLSVTDKGGGLDIPLPKPSAAITLSLSPKTFCAIVGYLAQSKGATVFVALVGKL